MAGPPFVPPGQPAGLPRPSPVNPIMPPPPGPNAQGVFSTPAAMAAWAKFYHIPMPPPPKPTAPTAGVPAGQFLGAPGSVKTPTAGPYPGYMTAEEMLDQAKQMADLSFAPVLQAAGDQQRMLHAQNMAQLAAIQQAYSLMGVDPKSPLGVANYNKALAEAQSSESDFAGKIVDLVAQRGQAQAGYLSDLQKQQAGLYGDYEAAHKPQIHYWANGRITALDPSTGQLTEISPGEAKALGETKLQTRVINGHTVLFDNTTGTFLDPITHAPITKLPTKAGKPAALPVVDNTASKDRGVWVDNHGIPIPSLQGVPVPPRWKPGTTGKNGVKPPTADTLKQAEAFLQDSFYHPSSGNVLRKITPQQLDGILVRSRNARLAAWLNEQKGMNSKDKKAFLADHPRPRLLTREDVARMSPEQKRILGVAGDAISPQDAYMKLIGMQIPARKAWQMVRKYYPNFGADYFPKGDAVETAATTSGFGSRLVNFAKQQLGQTYVWGGESRKEGGFDCSGLVDWAMRQEGYTGPRVTTWTLRDMGQHITRKNIQPGDLIITNDGKHVVIYAGNNQVVAGSSAAGKVVTQPLAGITINEIRRIGGERTATEMSAKIPADSKPDPNSARKYAFSVARQKYHWSPADLASLRQLWQKESGWNYKSKNNSSGAAGIPQALGHKLPPGYETNPQVQINWGLNYIKERYGTPTRAWAFWRATVNKNANLAPPELRGVALQWISKGYAGY